MPVLLPNASLECQAICRVGVQGLRKERQSHPINLPGYFRVSHDGDSMGNLCLAWNVFLLISFHETMSFVLPLPLMVGS